MSLLKYVASMLSNGMENKDLRKLQMQKVYEDFCSAGVFLETAKGDYVRSIVKALVASEDGKLLSCLL